MKKELLLCSIIVASSLVISPCFAYDSTKTDNGILFHYDPAPYELKRKPLYIGQIGAVIVRLEEERSYLFDNVVENTKPSLILELKYDNRREVMLIDRDNDKSVDEVYTNDPTMDTRKEAQALFDEFMKKINDRNKQIRKSEF